MSWSSGAGGGGAPVDDPNGWGIPYSMDPRLITQNGTHASANRAYYYKAIGGGTISKVGLYVNVQAGNISIAVCRASAPGEMPTERIATTGEIACPGGGFAEVALTSSVTVDARTDWFAISASDATAQFGRGPSAPGLGDNVLYKGFLGYQNAAHPIPATPSVTAGDTGGRWFCLVGRP